MQPTLQILIRNSRLWHWLGVAVAAGTMLVYLASLQPGHDWGSDFSQYIAHARNMVTGLAYKATGHIQNPHNSIAPEVYPPVFPLLLAPVYAIYGVNIIAFKVVVVLCFTGFLLLVQPVFRRKLPAPAIFFITVLLALNPSFYLFKENILSEFPFLFFLFLSFFLTEMAIRKEHHRNAWIYFALAGLGLYLVIGCRSAGIVLLPAWLGHYLFRKNKPGKWLAYIGLSLAVFAFFYLAQKLYLDSSGESYIGQWQKKYHAGTFAYNLKHYFKEAGLLWTEGANSRITLFLVCLLLVLSGVGIWLRIKKYRPTVYELFTAGYLALTLIWPWYQGFRMLIPLVPLLFFYAFYAVYAAFSRRPAFVLGFSGVLFLIWLLPYFRSYSRIDAAPPGNFIRNDTAGMLTFIANTPRRHRVLFIKPRIIALYTGHPAIVPHCPEQQAGYTTFIKQFKISYIVLSKKEFTSETRCLRSWTELHPDKVTLVYQNNGFDIFKVAE